MISICIPLYKPDFNYLKILSDSIKNQTIIDFEVIISDDDNDYEMVKQLFNGINYQYFKNNEPHGIFYNLNNAILNSKGEYVQIICQDDILKNNLLEFQLKTLSFYSDAAFVYTQCEKIDHNNKIIKSTMNTGFGFIPVEDLSNLLLIFGCLPGNLSTVMIKRSVLDEFNLFETSLLYASDFNLWIRISEKYGMAINYDELLLLRCHENQASFTLENKIATSDMVINMKLLFHQTKKLNFLKKYLHVNNIYGVSIIAKTINNIKKRKIRDLQSLFILKHPLNIILIILFSFLYFLGFKIKIIFNEYQSFPKPQNFNNS